MKDMEKRAVLVWGSVVAVVLLAAIAGSYGGYLGARFAPGLKFRILGPDVLFSGEAVVVTWDTSPENQRRYPSDKIEFCRGRAFGADCVTLNPDTTNDGEALVYVPSNMKTGPGVLRLTARARPGGPLLPSISSTRPVEVRHGTTLRPGERLVVAWNPDAKYPEVKIEFCVRQRVGEACTTLAHRVRNTGRSPELVAPTGVPRSPGVIRVRARGRAGRLALTLTPLGPRMVERAAAIVSRQPPGTRGEPPEERTEERDGAPSEEREEAARPPRPPVGGAVPHAVFLAPRAGHTVRQDTPLATRVRLTYLAGDEIVCQEWTLDGREVPREMWIGGQSPDASEGPCDRPALAAFLDVNGDGRVTAEDVEIVRDVLNGRDVDVPRTGAPGQNQENPLDVDGDGTVAPRDVLLIIQYLNIGERSIP